MNAGWIIGGLALAGGVGFFLYERNKTATGSTTGSSTSSSSTTTTTSGALSDATQKAVTLMRLGHPQPAAYWANEARANNPSAADLAALSAVGL